MRSIGYFIYGFVSALMLFTLTFRHTMDIFLDDYYVEKFYNEWCSYWNLTNLIITALFGICSIIWVYYQGASTACEEKLLKEKEDE